MSKRTTPETDAARHDLSDYGSPVPCSWGDWIHADVASKLERERDEARERLSPLLPIGDRLRTQDNRCTADPMFCVQILVREIGYDSAWSDSLCWVDGANEIVVYDDDPDFKEPTGKEWDCFGYKDRWETVMVAFTEEGCKRYLDLNGHNDRRRAHRGQVRIYADTFRRCPEMLAIREFLEATYEPADIPARDEARDEAALWKWHWMAARKEVENLIKEGAK